MYVIIICIKMTITIKFILRKFSKFQFQMNEHLLENRKYRKLKMLGIKKNSADDIIRLTIHAYTKLAFRVRVLVG